MKSPGQPAIEEIRTRWFPNHTATFQQLAPNIARLKWAQPGTSMYAVRYVLDHGTLMVWGDLGEAVYQWGQNDITFDWLAGVDLHYFHSKCQASEMGRYFYDFDPAGVRAAIHAYLAERPDLALGDIPLDQIQCEHSAVQVLGELPFEGETLSDFLRAGKSIHLRCAAHWVGLRMAHENKARIAA